MSLRYYKRSDRKRVFIVILNSINKKSIPVRVKDGKITANCSKLEKSNRHFLLSNSEHSVVEEFFGFHRDKEGNIVS